jgi:protein-tyrosine phosphatase
MFSFFKKRNLVTDISWLGVDIHSHIIPGIDDGSQSVEQSLSYIKQLQDLGFEKLFFTPHIYPELYPNTPATINPALQLVKDGLAAENNSIPVAAAAEHMIDYSFTVQDNHMCLPNKHILIEMSYLSESPNIEKVVFDLQIEGYTVVLAHPERYNFYHKTLERYHRLREMGCLFQLNILAVTGYYGKGVKQASDYLLKQNLYDLAATDLHHDKHMSLLTRIVRNGELYNAIGHYEFKNRALFL